MIDAATTEKEQGGQIQCLIVDGKFCPRLALLLFLCRRMKKVFTVSSKVTERPCLSKWQNQSAHYLAVSTGQCTALCWDYDGDILAILNDKTSNITLFDSNNRKSTILESTLGQKTLDGQASIAKYSRHILYCFLINSSILRASLTFATWSQGSKLLAVGSNRGNLLIYSHKTSKKVPIIGKHTDRITCGAFNSKDILALGGDDQQISVSNADGETSYTFMCTGEPRDIQFSEIKENERTNAAGETTISAIIGQKTLMLINLNDVQNPLNLQFQARYGSLVQYAWYGDGYILLGFELGYLVSVSTHASEIGQEIFSVQEYKANLTSLIISSSFGKVITAGDSCIKCRELSQLSDVSSITNVENEDKSLSELQITSDGQFLTLSTNSGLLHVYLTKLPVLGCACGTKVARLSSLTEVTVISSAGRSAEKTIVFNIDFEPSLLALGPSHIAVCSNNKACFYSLSRTSASLVLEREYVGSISTMRLNYAFAGVIYEGKLQLHTVKLTRERFPIEFENSSKKDQVKIFPEPDKANAKVTSVDFFDNFLILSTDIGHLQYFSTEDWKMVNEYRHTCGIGSLFAQSYGTMLIFLDDKIDSFLYNPINDNIIEIPDIKGQIKGVLWESASSEKDIFVVYDSNNFHTYAFHRDTIDGCKLVCAGHSKLNHDHTPLSLYDGTVNCLTSAGKVATVQLATHKLDAKFRGGVGSEIDIKFKLLLTLKKWQSAFTVCETLNDRKYWKLLGNAALESLEVELAIRVFRKIEDVSMVWNLEELRECEERNLLSAHLASFLENFDLAEQLYLQSSQPLSALEMRRDLLQWDKALTLADRLEPNEIPFIAKEHAQQLEFLEDYANSLIYFEKGLVSVTEDLKDKIDHNEICTNGIARNSIRLGDVRRGLQVALSSNQKSLKKECATLLETSKNFNEAGQLYESGQFYDKATLMFIKAKNWPKVAELSSKVSSQRIHIQYAKAMEMEKKYKISADAYRTAKDYDNLVRILLDHLNNPEEAVRIVQECKSVEGAKLIAQFFLKINDQNSAIQFLVMSHCHAEAFKLAIDNDKVEVYASLLVVDSDFGIVDRFNQKCSCTACVAAEILDIPVIARICFGTTYFKWPKISKTLEFGIINEGSETSPEQHVPLAKYFEKRNKYFLAGKHYYFAGFYEQALNLLIKNGDDNDSIKIAVECVGTAQDDALTEKLLKFLVGEMDGVPKDPRHLFRLYLAKKMLTQASKTALVIAREEQNTGQYRVAHSLLFGMYQELRTQSITIPAEMDNNLMLLHSYLLVKNLIKRGSEVQAARMLIRVGNNISKFPCHIVEILTSAVIQCYKSNLKNSAFKFAAMLMRNEYRKIINEKYRKKIESIVRKPEKVEEEETESPCPYCQTMLPDSQLLCTNCKNNIPYCIVTGQHIVSTNLTYCPNCRFPGTYDVFKSLCSKGEQCPMCSQVINERDVKPCLESFGEYRTNLVENSPNVKFVNNDDEFSDK